MNKVILVGRLTADPELRTTQSGINMCRFSVAVDRRFTTQGGERQADFIPCVAWRTQADFVSKYFNKGKLIGVEGSLQSRPYEDQQGNKRTAYEVSVDNVEFVGSKSESGGGNSSGNFQTPPSSGRGQNFPAQNASYSASPAYPPPQQQNAAFQSGDEDDFQEITDDADLPF